MKIQALLSIITASIYAEVNSLECSSGFGQKLRVIPDGWINDGYCDCPLDSLDEPTTDACSGAPVGGWAGVISAMDRSPTFVCPQQPTMKLPLSRLNDGVCDCCDGADETDGTTITTVCKDICDEVLRAEREARAKAEAAYKIGSELRKEELEMFDILVEETLTEIEHVEKELAAKELEIHANTKLVSEAKVSFVEQRRQEFLNILSSASPGLLDPLTDDEVAQLIQLTCQIAGEMEGSIKERTCVPLRLAGVELGILWSDEVFVNVSAEILNTHEGPEKSTLSELVIKNSNGQKLWSTNHVNESKKKKHRRRLDDQYPDDDYDSEYDEDDYGDDDDEPIDEDIVNTRGETESNEVDEEGDEIRNVKAAVEGSVFSQSRKNFLAQSTNLVSKIEEFIKKMDEDTKREEEGIGDDGESENLETVGDEPSAADDEEEDQPFDPMAYNLAKSALQRRQQAIKRGFQYAVSARILVDAVKAQGEQTQVRQNLINLAMGTLFHSRASTEHVWRLLTAILPEYATSNDFQTCSSPLASICPAKAITRNESEYPPASYMHAALGACERAVDEINAAGCSASSSDEIITTIPDGYYGYNEIRPRSDDDHLEQLFSPMKGYLPTEVGVHEAKQRMLEEEKKSIEDKIKSLEDKIGGREQGDVGKAELHGIKDQCYVVTEGKYDYEVCIYGKSAQRDKGNKSGGTSLGEWIGMEVDQETGARVMKWDRGQKCWNGPQRSATVLITCGAETKLLSAEEPDTCRYVMEMESYIACDDAFYQKYLA